MRLSYSCGL